MPPVRITDAEIVAIADLSPYPHNPRRGDVTAIAESLAAHGQYRPIVVNRRTGEVLAGNHTLLAAKRLRWKKIAVTWVDVDDEAAARIVLADNRTSDLATYDDNTLATLLRSLPDLDGTGFGVADLDALEGLFVNPPPPPRSAEQQDGEEVGIDDDAKCYIGTYHFTVNRPAFDEWAEPIRNDAKPVDAIRVRLRLPARPPVAASDPEATPVRMSQLAVTSVPIDSIGPYPCNAREGDVGAIAESLAENGQYRPVVVNAADHTILVGNHTWRAAKALGWTEISVTFVAVDEEEAKRIVLVDNRTADLATYNTDDLVELLMSLHGNLAGTGFSGDDLDDLLNGASGRPSTAVSGDVRVTVDRWRQKVPADDFAAWVVDLGPDPYIEIARRLDWPPGSWHAEGIP
jgi:ParB-like chromosome segregation protein Spo0J